MFGFQGLVLRLFSRWLTSRFRVDSAASSTPTLPVLNRE